MGLWRWLFPSPAERIERGTRMVEAGRFAEARLDMLDLAGPEALAVRTDAEVGLARLNLREAVACAAAGNDERATEHLSLVDQFSHGRLAREIADARRQIRTDRVENEATVAARLAAHEARARQVDPLAQELPQWITQRNDLVDGSTNDETAARAALLLEGYPEALRTQVAALGAPFLRAVLDLDDGRPDLANPALLALDTTHPAVCWELARTSAALGDVAQAATYAALFAEKHGKHAQIGTVHSGVFLADLLAAAGDPAGGLRVLHTLGPKHPGRGLEGVLREATGDLAGAERVWTELIRTHPGQMDPYRMLARVRLRGGHRLPAMVALEAGLTAVCCTPGKCGATAPDRESMRLLATLYLEDGIEKTRALELADDVAKLPGDDSWEDGWMGALMARAQSASDADELREAVLDASDEQQAARVAAVWPTA